MLKTDKQPERVLVRAPNWVGDAIMVTPALRSLRRGLPQAHITVEARPFLRDLLADLDSVDEFLPDPGKRLRDLVRRVRRLRERRFDFALLFPDSQRAALAPFLARIPVRFGYARDVARRVLMTDSMPPPSEHGKRLPISMIERYLRLTRALGCEDDGDETEVPFSEAAHASIFGRLHEGGVPAGAELLVAVPGANFGSSKLWPTEHFASACDEIGATRGFFTVIAPGPGEWDLGRRIVEQMHGPAYSITSPGTSLGELAALIRASKLVVTNDTGPRHIGITYGVPTVVVMGPTDPRHTQHQMERQRVVREEVECSPCGLKRCPIDHRCMTRLAPERVVTAAEELLG